MHDGISDGLDEQDRIERISRFAETYLAMRNKPVRIGPRPLTIETFSAPDGGLPVLMSFTRDTVERTFARHASEWFRGIEFFESRESLLGMAVRCTKESADQPLSSLFCLLADSLSQACTPDGSYDLDRLLSRMRHESLDFPLPSEEGEAPHRLSRPVGILA